MRAVLLTRHGGPETLEVREVPDARPGPGQVLVDVVAASVNAADYKVRKGVSKLKVALPHILGRDFSGVVTATGEGVTGLAVGDAVFGVMPPGVEGTYAEKLAIDAAIVARKPPSISHAEAAALALAGITALSGVEDTLAVRAGETVLVQGGAGGVGGLAVQLAKAAGARVVATASAANADYVRSLGADQAIDYRNEDFVVACPPCDAVLDTVGGEVLVRSFEVLKTGGRIMTVGPPTQLPADIRKDVRFDLSNVVRSRAALERLLALLDAGRIVRPTITTFPLEGVREAHRISEGRHLTGKLVLLVREGAGP